MRIYTRSQTHERMTYRFSSMLGQLRAYPHARTHRECFPTRVRDALILCDEPYRLQPDLPTNAVAHPPSNGRAASAVLRRTMMLHRAGFLLARLYAARRAPLFPDSRSAIAWFNRRTPSELYGQLCLPRSLFAAKTSAAFEAAGVVLIGTMLPNRTLHAWVIENRCQPDDLDRLWICYQPIAALA